MRTKCVSQRRKGRLDVRSFERNAKPRTQEDRQMYTSVSGDILRMAVVAGPECLPYMYPGKAKVPTGYWNEGLPKLLLRQNRGSAKGPLR